MKTETAISILGLAFVPFVFVEETLKPTAKKLSNKIEDIACEVKNRKHFDKQTGYIRIAKRK